MTATSAEATSVAPDIDEALIERVVRAFYDRVRRDPLIGPVFEHRIADWEPHLRQMFAFWSSVMLRTGRYRGEPMRKHAALPVDATHFDRWLELFDETVEALCTPPVAALWLARARLIGRSLEMGVAVTNGKLVGPGERYYRGATG
jgi:hemoglobin